MTSTNDNCLGSDCPLYKDCFVVKARKKAMDADVVVVNHHLFPADMVVKESGFAELIPEAEVMIFDEAHQLPDIASQYFGQSLSSRQLLDLAKDITIAYRTELKDTQQLQNAPIVWRKARRISVCSWAIRAIAAICANCWRIATFSARCCCSMTRLNCVMTSPNSRLAARRCSTPPLSARRSTVAA